MEYAFTLLKFISDKLGYPIHYEAFIGNNSFTLKIQSNKITEDIARVIKNSIEAQKDLRKVETSEVNLWGDNILLIYLKIQNP